MRGWGRFLKDEAVEVQPLLAEAVRNGIGRLLHFALESEVEVFIEGAGAATPGCRRAIRSGFMPQREVESALGKIPVRVPRVRFDDAARSFRSCIVRRYARRLELDADMLIDAYIVACGRGVFGELLHAIAGYRSGYIPHRIVQETDRRMAEAFRRQACAASAQAIILTPRIGQSRVDMLVLRQCADSTVELQAVVPGESRAFTDWMQDWSASSSDADSLRWVEAKPFSAGQPLKDSAMA